MVSPSSSRESESGAEEGRPRGLGVGGGGVGVGNLLKAGRTKADAPSNEINLFYMRPRHRHSVAT